MKVKSNREDIKPAGLHIQFTVDYDKETRTATAVTDDEGNALVEVTPSPAAVAFSGLDQESDWYSRLITAARETEAGKVCRIVLPRALLFGMVTVAAVSIVVPGGALVSYGVGQGCLAAASGVALGGGVFCANEFVKEAMAPTPQQAPPDYVRSIPKTRTMPAKSADPYEAVRDRAKRELSDMGNHVGEVAPENDRSMAGGQSGDPNGPPEDPEDEEELKTTKHGADRIADNNPSRGGTLNQAEIEAAKSGRQMTQGDGARVYIQEVAPGKYNVVVEGERGLITSFRHLRLKSVLRLTKNYGWKEF